jgi:alanine racemase
MNPNSHPTWIEIDLDAIAQNTKIVLEETKVAVMAVVKADAYGYGAVPVAKTVLKAGVKWLSVVRAQEAHQLREAGIEAPILVLGGATPAELDRVIEGDISVPLMGFDWLAIYEQRARALGKAVRVHLKVDTGLGRFGVFPDEALELARRAKETGLVDLEGIFSHFSSVDVPGHPATAIQIQRYQQVLENLRNQGITFPWMHLSSSGGVGTQPDAYFNMVRVGSALWGLGNVEDGLLIAPRLKKAFSWKAQLMSCKRFPAGWKIGYGQDYTTQEGEVIGVVPAGHGDGFLRHPKNEILVSGKRAPVVGNVCLDQMMVRLPEMMPIGTEVVLFGRQGQEAIEVEEAAHRWGISLSKVTVVHPRVPRIYKGG